MTDHRVLRLNADEVVSFCRDILGLDPARVTEFSIRVPAPGDVARIDIELLAEPGDLDALAACIDDDQTFAERERVLRSRIEALDRNEGAGGV